MGQPGVSLSAAVAQSAAFTALISLATTSEGVGNVTVAAAVADARQGIAGNLQAALAAQVASASNPDSAAAIDPSVIQTASNVLAALSAAALSDRGGGATSLTPLPAAAEALATTVTSAVRAVVNAAAVGAEGGGAGVSFSTASALLGALGDALASTATAVPPAPTPPGMNTSVVNALAGAPGILVGGSSPALVSAVTSTLSLLTAALLTSAAPGTAQSVTTAGGGAQVVLGSIYCGAAVSSTALKPAPGTAIDFPLSSALPPCPASDSAARNVAPNAAVLAAQTPPALTASSEAAAALAASAPGSSVALTQWGVSPFKETAGLSALSYAALPSLSDLDLAATEAAAKSSAQSAVRRLSHSLLRALGGGVNALDTVLAAVGGTSAASAANDALASTRPTTVVDLLPDRPLDSRVVSVRVADTAGNPVALARGVFTYSVTVPLRDLGILKWDDALKTATVDVGNSGFAQPAIRVKCPVSPAAATAGVAATYIRGGTGSAAVRVEKVLVVSYTGVIGGATTTGTGGPTLTAIATSGGGAVSVDFLALPAHGSNVSVGAALSARAPTLATTANAYILSFDCGAALARQTFVCGVGFENAFITFECPRVVALPTCLIFNASSRAWGSKGCIRTGTTMTSVTCKCDVPGDVAVRFAALPQAQYNVFAVGGATSSSVLLSVWYGAFGLLAAVFVANAVGVVFGRDALRAKLFTQRLASDTEFVYVKAASVAAGVKGWSLGRVGASSRVAQAPLLVDDSAGADKKSALRVSIMGARITAPREPVAALFAAVSRWADPHRVTLPPPSDASAVSSARNTPSLKVRPRVTFVSDEENSFAARAGVADVEQLVREWRAATRRTALKDDEEYRSIADDGDDRGVMSANVVRPSPFWGVVRARVFRGEPPALLIAVASSARFFVDESRDALAAPRISKCLGALAAITASGAGAALFYAYLLDAQTLAGSPAFVALSVQQTVSLAFAIAMFVSVPVDVLVLAALRCRARAAARSRLPGLAAELRRRRRAAAVLAPLPTSALLRLVGAGHPDNSDFPTLTDEESMAADAGAPPGWEAEPPAAIVETCSVLLSACGRRADSRGDLESAAANAAQAVGLAPPDGASGRGEQFSPTALSVSSQLREAIENVQVFEASSALSFLVDVAALFIVGFCTLYICAFALVRGPMAAASAAGAWFVSAALTVVVIRPAIVAARVAIAFATGGVFTPRPDATDAAPLLAYFSLIAVPTAAASAARRSVSEAVAALVPPERLAQIYSAGSEVASAHAALRAALLARAYMLLTSPIAQLSTTAGEAFEKPPAILSPPPTLALEGLPPTLREGSAAANGSSLDSDPRSALTSTRPSATDPRPALSSTLASATGLSESGSRESVAAQSLALRPRLLDTAQEFHETVRTGTDDDGFTSGRSSTSSFSLTSARSAFSRVASPQGDAQGPPRMELSSMRERPPVAFGQGNALADVGRAWEAEVSRAEGLSTTSTSPSAIISTTADRLPTAASHAPSMPVALPNGARPGRGAVVVPLHLAPRSAPRTVPPPQQIVQDRPQTSLAFSTGAQVIRGGHFPAPPRVLLALVRPVPPTAPRPATAVAVRGPARFIVPRPPNALALRPMGAAAITMAQPPNAHALRPMGSAAITLVAIPRGLHIARGAAAAPGGHVTPR